MSLLLTLMSVVGVRYCDHWGAQRQEQEQPPNPLTTQFANEVLEQSQQSAVDLPDDLRPNIVLINLDDAERELMADPVLKRFLPNMHQLAAGGVRFQNCHVTSPLCGPSRTCLLYSQHAHRTGVRANRNGGPLNNGYSGGYQVLEDARIARQHMGTWMQTAGYRTLAVGKYLHELPETFAAPGWDEILMARGDRYFETYYTRARHGSEKLQYTAAKTDFRTDLEAEEMDAMLKLHGTLTFARRRPFFMYLTPMAPHEPASGQTMIAPRHVGLADDASLPWSDSFDEDDMSDKPDQFKNLKALGRYRMVMFKRTFRRRVEALMSVDEQIGKLRERLKVDGELDNTYIFLTSDHGYLLGHHRMFGKQVPYNRSTNVPLIVWSAAIEKRLADRDSRSVDHLVSHLDLAPTFLDIAGHSCERSDGKSFADLLEDPQRISPAQWREDLLIQNFERKRVFDEVCQCAYAALRSRDALYVHWANGEREYYDLSVDPDQMSNRWSELSKEQRLLFERRLRAARVESSSSSIGRPTEPVVTLANPSKWEPMLGDQFKIKGIAEDDRGVNGVELSIQHPQTKRFWNGQQWQKKRVLVEAEMANPGGILSVWSYALDKHHLAHSQFLIVNAIATTRRGDQATTGEVEARYPPAAIAVKRPRSIK